MRIIKTQDACATMTKEEVEVALREAARQLAVLSFALEVKRKEKKQRPRLRIVEE